MIVPERKPRWIHLVLTYRGSALQRVKLRLLSVFLVACLVTIANERLGWPLGALTALPFSLIGFVLGIFLGFRTNTSYDRFWEGRRLWGQLVNETRSFARQTLLFLAATPDAEPEITTQRDQARQLRVQLVRRVIGFVHALRMHLRDGVDVSQLMAYVPATEVDAMRGQRNLPLAILQAIASQLHDASRKGLIHPYHLPTLDQCLADLTDIQGGCERIKNTPIPHSYTVLIHGIVALYCFALPFGLVETLHAWTPRSC